jgi:hypothetical protein
MKDWESVFVFHPTSPKPARDPQTRHASRADPTVSVRWKIPEADISIDSNRNKEMFTGDLGLAIRNGVREVVHILILGLVGFCNLVSKYNRYYTIYISPE